MRPYLLLFIILVFLAGCGTEPNVPLVQELSSFSTAQKQCSDFLEGKDDLSTNLEKDCSEFLKRLEKANTSAIKLQDNRLKKGERKETTLVYARQRNRAKQSFGQLLDSVKKATLQTINDDNIKGFSKAITFPKNYITPVYYDYMRSKAPYFDKNKYYVEYRKNTAKSLYKKGRSALKHNRVKQAEKLFLQAADMNSTKAAFELGRLYEGKDDTKAFKWYQKAADADITDAYVRLGHLYKRQGDSKSALKWYTKAAVLDDAQAQYQLYISYSNQDQQKAVYWLKKASENGNTQAQFIYAQLLIKKGETDKAIDLLQKASLAGNAKATLYLGKYFYELKMYGRALKQLQHLESAESFYIQAKMLEHGQGLPRDYHKAYNYYMRASSMGYTQAKDDIQRLDALMNEEQQRLAQEEKKRLAEEIARMAKECGALPTPKDMKKRGKKFHLVGTASAPVGQNSFIIYGDDGSDYYLLGARGIHEDDKVDIAVKSTGSTATLTTADDEESDIYQFRYIKKCTLEEKP